MGIESVTDSDTEVALYRQQRSIQGWQRPRRDRPSPSQHSDRTCSSPPLAVAIGSGCEALAARIALLARGSMQTLWKRQTKDKRT
jgi:hypothetical protein